MKKFLFVGLRTLSSERLADEIKAIALSSGAQLVGFASAEHLEEGSRKVIGLLICARKENTSTNPRF